MGKITGIWSYPIEGDRLNDILANTKASFGFGREVNSLVFSVGSMGMGIPVRFAQVSFPLFGKTMKAFNKDHLISFQCSNNIVAF